MLGSGLGSCMDKQLPQAPLQADVWSLTLMIVFGSRIYCIYSNPVEGHGNSKGVGISEAKIFKRKHETKLEFPEVGGGVGELKPKNPLW